LTWLEMHEKRQIELLKQNINEFDLKKEGNFNRFDYLIIS